MSEWNFCPSCGSSLLGVTPVYCATCGSRLKAETHTEPARDPGSDSLASPVVHHLAEGDSRRVPEEVPYGLYRVTAWVELRDDAGSVITQDTSKVPSGMPGLLLADRRCATITAEISGVTLTPLPLAPVIDVLGDALEYGVFIVGADIPVGTYRLEDIPTANGGTAHSWTRFDGLLNVIADDYQENSGGAAVTIEPEDFAFAFMGALRPTDVSPEADGAPSTDRRRSSNQARRVRKLTPLDELVEYVQSKAVASDEVLYLQDPVGMQDYISSIVLSDEDKAYLKHWAHYISLQEIPLSEWSSQDFLHFSVISLHLTELESGQSIVDDVNAYVDSLDLNE